MIHTRICDLLGVEHPILNAPMGGVAGGALAAAVSNAGGFGMIGGTSSRGPAWLRQEIRAARDRTNRTFGIGFITAFPGVDDLVRVAIEEKVAAIGHSFADPTPYVAAAHDVGIKVFNQVQTVAHAKRAVAAAVDLIVAQGTEAGGHTGYSGTLPLTAAVLDVAGSIPVIAAGGIGDGRGLAAVIVLGAEGAWIGTRFIASVEAGIAQWAKDRVVAASTDDTVLTHAYDLAAAAPFPAGIGDRVLRNDFTDQWHDKDGEVVARRTELQQQVNEAIDAANPRIAPDRAGNASGLIHGIEPAGDIIRRIVAEAETLLRERPVRLLRP